MDHLDETLASLDDLACRLVVEVGETAMSPLAATKNAVRGVFNALCNRTVG